MSYVFRKIARCVTLFICFLFVFIQKKDIVDILIGWYIEPLPTDLILDYTAQALYKFRPFWIEQIETTTLTLLDHFIEDADNYAQVTRK